MIAVLSGALVVGLGAVGSHALGPFLEASGRTDTYQTAIRYHIFHTLAMMCLGILGLQIRSKGIIIGAYLMLAGMIMFSGSLYLLSLTGRIWLAYLTPAGGITLIVSWLFVFYGLLHVRWDINTPE